MAEDVTRPKRTVKRRSNSGDQVKRRQRPGDGKEVTKRRKKPAAKPISRRSKAPSGLYKIYLKSQLSQKKRLGLYRKLSKYLKNSIPQPSALDILYNLASDDGKKPKKPIAVILDQWRQTVREGKGLGEAIDGWVPAKDQVIIASGESAGKLEGALENAAFIQESTKKITSAIKKGLAYPVLLLAMTVGFMFVVARVMVPAFDEIKPKETWTGSGAQMASLADFVDNYLVYILAIVGLIISLVIWSLPRWTGRLRAKFDKLPPYSLYRLSEGSGFLMSIAALISAGVAIPHGLKIIRKTASPWYKERLNKTLAQMDGGKTFGEALYHTKLNFPDKEAVSEIRVYATLDGFEEELAQLGAEWLDDSVEKITEQASMMRISAILIMSTVFMWIANGIFSLQQQVTSGL